MSEIGSDEWIAEMRREYSAEEVERLVQEYIALRSRLNTVTEALAWYGDKSNWEVKADAHGHRQRPAMVYKWSIADVALRRCEYRP